MHLRLPLTLSEAIEGARVDVPTLTGSIKLKVPEGTQNGSKLRVRGKGVPGTEGDLIVTLDVRLPEGSPDDVKRLAREISDYYDEDPREDFKL